MGAVKDETGPGAVADPEGAEGLTPARHREPYSTLAVVATSAALLAVPAISLIGHRRIAVLWLAGIVAVLAAVRSRRPEGTWIAARGRVFDVVFGFGLAAALVLLSYYAGLPRVL